MAEPNKNMTLSLFTLCRLLAKSFVCQGGRLGQRKASLDSDLWLSGWGLCFRVFNWKIFHVTWRFTWELQAEDIKFSLLFAQKDKDLVADSWVQMHNQQLPTFFYMFSQAQLTREISWTRLGHDSPFWRPRILHLIYKDFLKTVASFYSLTWWVLLFPTPKSSCMQQQMGSTPGTGAASPAALQAGILRSVLHPELSQLWPGMGQRSGDRLLVKPAGANTSSHSSAKDTVPCPTPRGLEQPCGLQKCSCFVFQLWTCRVRNKLCRASWAHTIIF